MGEVEVQLIGQKIVDIRKMTQAEYEAEGWEDCQHGLNHVIVLENGAKIYASSDDEGNCAGTLFGSLKGKSFYV